MRAIFFSHLFPYKSLNHTYFSNTLTLGIGGNIKDCKKRFERLLQWFMKNKNFYLLSTSPIYRNPPFGYVYQNDFYNVTITLSTKLCVVEVFALIFYLERKFGRPRKRVFKNAPRTLDIDVIFFNDLILKRPYLKIPHPKWNQRESVLIPMFLQYLHLREWK